MVEKVDNTLVNINQMHHHRIDVQDDHFMQKPMGITFPEEYEMVPLYISGTIVCAGTSSLTQQQLEYFPQIVLT